METIIKLIASEKIVVIFIILILSVIIYYMLKSVFKVILIVAIAFLLYYVYMSYNKKENFESIQQHLDKTIQELNEKKDKTNKIIDYSCSYIKKKPL